MYHTAVIILFVAYLTTLIVSQISYDRIDNNMERDVDGSGRGLIGDPSQEFTWRG